MLLETISETRSTTSSGTIIDRAGVHRANDDRADIDSVSIDRVDLGTASVGAAKNCLGRFLKLAAMMALLAALILAVASPARAATETILHNFTCEPTDGCDPYAGVVLDAEGNLYSTTYSGGAYGAGEVFELSPSGTLTLLHSFGNDGVDGIFPEAGVILDSQDNLYGTTYYGGNHNCGTVFELTSSGSEAWVYSFDCFPDGANPYAGVVLDSEGNLYGTTLFGGLYGEGTVFKLVPSTQTLTTLHSFGCSPTDGCFPYGGVVLDSQGNIYGTTVFGGTDDLGTVFKVTPSGTESLVHNFDANGKDGFRPYGGVMLDANDNLYGTTQYGGALGVGTVFEVNASGEESVLYSFKGGKHGIEPEASLIFDAKGNLYGTTFYGGSSDLGTVFELTAAGAEKVLHSFADNGTDGYNPETNLAIDGSGNLYGTTPNGGNSGNCEDGCGTVFKIGSKAKDKKE
jgi:uncharacterized repeat protein (TIGR03803 family)